VHRNLRAVQRHAGDLMTDNAPPDARGSPSNRDDDPAMRLPIEAGRPPGASLDPAAEPQHQSADVGDQAASAQREAERAKGALVQLLARVSDGVVSIDTAWRLSYLNPVAQELVAALGLDPAATLGEVVWETFPGLVRTSFGTEIRRAARAHAPVEFEAQLASLNRCYQVRVFPGDDGVTVLFRDSTAERERRTTLEAREAFFRALGEAVPGLLWASDAHGRPIYVNAAWSAYTGASLEELAASDWRRFNHPDDLGRMEAAWQHAEHTRTPLEFEFRRRRHDGTYRWFLGRSAPLLDAAGRIEQWVGLDVDIDDRKRAEADLAAAEGSLRLITDALPVLISYIDADERYRFNNITYEHWFGSPRAGFFGRRIEELVGPESYEAVRGYVARALAGESVEFEAVLSHWGPAARHVHGSYVPDRGPDGRVRGFFALVSDVSERRQTEERLRQGAKMEAIGRLAGGLAHDFANQLNVQMGFAALVARDPGLGETSRQDLEEIHRAAERMAALTHQLLAFSRQQVIAPETLDLNAPIDEARSLLQRLIGSHIDLTLDLDSAPLWVRVDRAQLTQVLLNLAINARDAMPDGGVLSIRTQLREIAEEIVEPLTGTRVPPGLYAQLAVEDSGCGIEPAVLAHIWEPFFTTKDVGQGTGLGLATVYGIVQQSRGYVWATSRIGDGSLFTVLLPSASPAQAAPVEEAASLPARRSHERILVVEDEDPVRAVIVRSLELEGFSVEQARHGAEALAVLERDEPAIDAVLSDVVMPVMDGHAFAEYLARRYPAMPLLLMSGYSRETSFPGGSLGEQQAFIQKPVTQQMLARTLRCLLQGRSLPP
jgi:two-component system cell cycle sensor histidine kinase/response regulator CckA